MSGMQIDTGEHGPWALVSVAGEVDLATSPELRAALDAAIAASSQLVLDLSQVTFLDSTGLGVLVQAHQRALEDGSQLRLVVVESNVRRVIDVTGLDTVFSLHESLDAATS
jgi:anti-sigma B factor antagonist